MVVLRMSIDVQNLPPSRDIATQYPDGQTDDPAVLKTMIAALQAENAKISATLRVHDQLVQTSR